MSSFTYENRQVHTGSLKKKEGEERREEEMQKIRGGAMDWCGEKKGEDKGDVW